MDPMESTQSSTEAAAATVLDCAGSLDIAGVQSLYQQLSDALEAGTGIVFDVSRTERLDGAAAQLLYAFVRAARQRDLAVHWQQPSDAVSNAVRLLGLADGLSFPASPA